MVLGPLMYEVASLDTQDRLCPYQEFLEREMAPLSRPPPVVRLLAWRMYILAATGNSAKQVDLSLLFTSEYVDHMRYSFQLQDPADTPKIGRAFSCGGDITSLAAITNATAHGHNPNFQEIARIEWSINEITDPDWHCKLLQRAPAPSVSLEHTHPRNLCGLLKQIRAMPAFWLGLSYGSSSAGTCPLPRAIIPARWPCGR